VAARPLHAPPPLAASGSASSPLPFLAGGEDHRHLQPKENAQAVCFS